METLFRECLFFVGYIQLSLEVVYDSFKTTLYTER